MSVKVVLIGFIVGAVLSLSGCASGNRGDRVSGTEISIRYAEVIGIERRPLPTATPAGAMVGGFTGLVLARRSSPGRQLASAAGGAVLGGLATRALEGERLGYVYKLRYLNGSQSEFITEKGYLQTGDCVAVEAGTHKNLRRVSHTVCASSPNLSVPPVATHQYSADQCHQAKDQLLRAQGDDEIDAAARKVEVICHF